MTPSKQDYNELGGTAIQEDNNKAESFNQETGKDLVDYSEFGFRPEKKQQEEIKKEDYSQFGFRPEKSEKPKAGKFASALYGVAEGIANLSSLTASSFSKPLQDLTSTFPESEDQSARRIRVAGQTLPAGALGGIPGIVSGLVGSQAGQTVREVFGKEGKFEKFGWGEAAAIGADLVSGGLAGLGTSLAKNTGKVVAKEAPIIFRTAEKGIEKKALSYAIQGEKNALQNVIDGFGEVQIGRFEDEVARISPTKFTEHNQTNNSMFRPIVHQMFRNTQLNAISPLDVTPEQGGRAMQEAANVTFASEVQGAERVAYTAARQASEGLSGEAPKTIAQAKDLRDDLVKNTPTPEQQPVISYLDNLIADLESTTPGSTTPASKIIDINGNSITPAIQNEANTQATTRSANDLVDLVQRGNQAVNYDGPLRYQSNRLQPILRTLREEVGDILATNPEAANAYQEANLLHARNAEVWGTKYMRNVRFSETPENLITPTQKASNMRNFKQAVQDPTIQNIAERQVVSNITNGKNVEATREAVRNLSPDLSPTARGAANQLIDIKDPSSTIGGRAAVRNDILKDAAKAVNTGTKPAYILDLMKTPKGYQLVKEALNGSPESISLMKAFERLYVEDIFKSVLDNTGMIDFNKAREIFKTPDIKQVVQHIGGDRLIKRFEKLETFSNNLEKNKALYSKPEVQSLFKTLLADTTKSIPLALLLHQLHMGWPIIAGLGMAKAGVTAAKATYKALEKNLLSNPKAFHYLEQLSKAKTVSELAKQLPRLLAEIDSSEEIEPEINVPKNK